jgi:uncharacterized protein (UPF0276 family)
MNEAVPRLGLGIGWRHAVASLVLRRPDLGFVEVLAEAYPVDRPLPLSLVEARRRGVVVVPHGVGLSVGGAEHPDPARIDFLAHLAHRVGAPLVSEHVAFVRADGIEAGHLLPVPRTRDALEVLVHNVTAVVEQLPVPLALEPIATLFEWPEPQLNESDFLCELVERTGTFLVLDVANVYANARNHGFEPRRFLAGLPLDRIAYVHVAGGVEREGLYHDTHAHAVPRAVLELLDDLSASQPLPGVMLERDDAFPATAVIEAELDAIRRAARLSGPDVAPGAPRLQVRQSSMARAGCTSSARRALAEDQATLLRALVGRGSVPAGFVPDHVRAAAAVLEAKRARFG